MGDIHFHEVMCTSKDGERFGCCLSAIFIGIQSGTEYNQMNTIKYLYIPDDDDAVHRVEHA